MPFRSTPGLLFSVAVAAFVARGSFGLLACGGPQFTAAPADDAGSSADSGGGGDAATLPFCSTVDADFCSDFDRAPLPEKWSNLNQMGGATGTEDGDASVSSPNSFLASSPAFPVGDGGTAPAARAVLSTLGLPKGQSHIAFDLRIDEVSFPSASAITSAVIVAAYTQGTDYTIALELRPAAGNTAPFTASLLELTTTLGNTQTKLDDLSGVFTELGAWYHVALDFGIDSTDAGVVPASITVTSGNATSSKVLLLTAPLASIGGARSLSIGVQSTPPAGAAKLRFDNVTYSH